MITSLLARSGIHQSQHYVDLVISGFQLPQVNNQRERILISSWNIIHRQCMPWKLAAEPVLCCMLAMLQCDSSFVSDIFECIAMKAYRLTKYGKKSTMSSREIQTAVRLLLPGAVAKHAVSEGTKTVTEYTSSKWTRSTIFSLNPMGLRLCKSVINQSTDAAVVYFIVNSAEV